MKEKYAIKNCSKKVDGEYLNNIHIDGGRLIRVNFVEKDSPSVLGFTSKTDAESLCQRIKKQLKIIVETITLSKGD